VGRTIILISHHVQLCAPDAKYIVGPITFASNNILIGHLQVALEKGRLVYSGPSAAFMNSSVMKSLI